MSLRVENAVDGTCADVSFIQSMRDMHRFVARMLSSALDLRAEDTTSAKTWATPPNGEKVSFEKYSSDAHLLSLLRQQSNARKQVLVTIIGGDSYSLFAWDWHERMHEISNETSRCHCFLIAMDEIGVVLAIQQGVPVFYSTLTFEQQLKWKNTIEARQHTLYRVGHAKFNTVARIARLGYSVMLSEMDVFWYALQQFFSLRVSFDSIDVSRRANPFDHLKTPIDNYDLQISGHFGAHPRVNIGLFYVQSSNASINFFSFVAEFWLRFGKGAFVSDQRVLDALLSNYDRLDPTYRRMVPTVPSLNWTEHVFGGHFSHMMTDGSAFLLFDRASEIGARSKKFYGDVKTKYFTVTVANG